MKLYMIALGIFLAPLLVMGKTSNNKVCTYQVSGMTCASCTLTLKVGVKKLEGIRHVLASNEDKKAIVTFDPSKTDSEEIKRAIDRIGYKATLKQCITD